MTYSSAQTTTTTAACVLKGTAKGGKKNPVRFTTPAVSILSCSEDQQFMAGQQIIKKAPCVFEEECIVTVSTPEKCSTDGRHRQLSTPLTSGKVVWFCTAFLLSFVPDSREANRQTRANPGFDVLFFVVCSHVDILFCHFPPKPQRTQKPNVGRKRFTWTRPPTVWLLRSDSSGQCSEL